MSRPTTTLRSWLPRMASADTPGGAGMRLGPTLASRCGGRRPRTGPVAWSASSIEHALDLHRVPRRARRRDFAPGWQFGRGEHVDPDDYVRACCRDREDRTASPRLMTCSVVEPKTSRSKAFRPWTPSTITIGLTLRCDAENLPVRLSSRHDGLASHIRAAPGSAHEFLQLRPGGFLECLLIADDVEGDADQRVVANRYRLHRVEKRETPSRVPGQRCRIVQRARRILREIDGTENGAERIASGGPRHPAGAAGRRAPAPVTCAASSPPPSRGTNGRSPSGRVCPSRRHPPSSRAAWT